MPREEILTLRENLGPWSDNPLSARQPAQHQGSVAFGQHPAIEQDHDSDVGAAPNQPPEALLELEGRVRQQIAHEAVFALLRQALEPRRRERLRRNLER